MDKMLILHEGCHDIKEDRLSERFIEHASPDLPLIHVNENREIGCSESVFAMELVGVVYSRNRHENAYRDVAGRVAAKEYTHSLMTGLSLNQRLEFVYTAGSDLHGRSSLNWRILGRSVGKSPEEAVKRAEYLWQNISLSLDTVGKEYVFSPVREKDKLLEDRFKDNWRGIIRPRGISINATQRLIGFARGSGFSEEMLQVIAAPLTENDAAKSLDSALGTLACPAPVRLVISVTFVRLSIDELQKVVTSLKWLQNRECKSIRYNQEIEECVEDEKIIDGLIHNLQLWVKYPYGYRVSCVTISERPIPQSLIRMVGSEVFNGSPVTFRVEDAGSEGTITKAHTIDRHRPGIIDLSDCINADSPFPSLFPETSSLIECGIKRAYKESPPDVAGGGILLGVNADHPERKVRLPRPDRSRHCYIIGATGTGKSTLLYNMIIQDIENGEGVAVIDPHGDLYKQVLCAIPKQRINDVVLVDPCDFEHAVGINFLECKGRHKNVQVNYITNEMIKIFDRLYDLRQTGGPMFEQYMRNALLLVMDNEFPGATLMDIPMVFEDSEYRDFLLERCNNTFVVNFWKRQAEKAGGDASLNNIAPYITCKLNQFTTNALLRPIIGQSRSAIDFRELMDMGKILLVNLSKGLLGELDTQLLGMLVIGKIFSSAMERISIPAENRKPMFLYVDEFQNFTTDTVAYLLSEARKFGLHLTLSNQNLAQLSANRGKQNILDSVLGNVGNILIFRLGIIDAERMDIYTRPELHAQDIQELPDFHIAGRLLVRNSPSQPFVFRTLPAFMEVKDRINSTRIINLSRQRYTKPTEAVEKDIIGRRLKIKCVGSSV
jgi:hypothetical protein